MDKNLTDGKYVTQVAFDSFVKSISQKLDYIGSATSQTIVRVETLVKLLCARGEVPSVDDFVEGLRKYDPFVSALRELRAVPKISERIEATLKYNSEHPDAFLIMADDINILEQAEDAESISRANYDNALRLPHTKIFAAALKTLLDKPE